MKDDNEPAGELIDLGAVSQETLGADGMATDFVRYMDQWGISKD